jgi:hypothetical protein
MIKAITTRIVQNVPPGAGEGQYPAMETTIADLPSKDFFLKTLDSPATTQAQTQDLDLHVSPPVPATKPERHVNNAGAPSVAVANKP